ncbi:MAG: response regulator transcription factor [Solirubrobacteraceae bacterium]|nr:response regulator transcription factor [Solirubrobacteraceae bacterium]
MSEPERRLRVLVVDDHDVVHWGFRLMLTQQPWVARCVSAASSAEALDLTRRYEPHVAVIDLFLGDESGVDLSSRLRSERPGLNVLLVSGAGQISAAAARAAGAAGFVSKDLPAADIARAVRMVGLGHSVFPPQATPSAIQLTAREREVLEHLGRGSTNREIALALHLSPHTIKEHTSVLYRKLDVRNRAEAVRRGQQIGLLD